MRLRRSFADIVIPLCCVAAAAFLLSGSFLHVRNAPLRVSVLGSENPNAAPIMGAGFAPNAVYSSTKPPALEGSVKLYGSWVGSDASVGSVHTQWFRAVPHFSILLAGYPTLPGNQLLIEVETKTAGTILLAAASDQNPGEVWRAREISLPQEHEPVRFRFVATDASTMWRGWFGFSEPYIFHGTDNVELSKQLTLIILSTITGLLVFIAPGLILRRKILQYSNQSCSFIWIPVPGAVVLSLLGLLCWKGPHAVSQNSIARVGLWLLVAYIAYEFIRFPISTLTSALERRVLLVVAVLAAICAAKATYSLGPRGELYEGEISRTLEVGDRSDSRIPYHVVQLIALRSGAYGPIAKLTLSPWNFSHRGPIASLAVSPIVLASPIKVLPVMPDQRWTPFDPQGFSVFRISMIALACSCLVIVFGLATLFLSEEWAFFAFLVTITAPFVIHEIYFTWPKLQAASFVLLAAYLVCTSRYFAAGLCLGFGYLFHPSALLWTPALVTMAPLSSAAFAGSGAKTIFTKLYRWSVAAASLGIGLSVWLLLWKFVNRAHFAQSGFLAYFTQPSGIATWLQSRYDSLANTLVPLNLFLFHRNDPSANPVTAPPLTVVQFFFQYWTALPFGIGIAFFFCMIRLLGAGFAMARGWLIWELIIPLAFVTIYWGASTTGLLREGLHAWVLGLLVYAVVMWNKSSGISDRFWRAANWTMLFRGLEAWCMLLLPSILSRHHLTQPGFRVTDVISLLAVTIGTGWLFWQMFSYGEKLRRAECPRN